VTHRRGKKKERNGTGRKEGKNQCSGGASQRWNGTEKPKGGSLPENNQRGAKNGLSSTKNDTSFVRIKIWRGLKHVDKISSTVPATEGKIKGRQKRKEGKEGKPNQKDSEGGKADMDVWETKSHKKLRTRTRLQTAK